MSRRHSVVGSVMGGLLLIGALGAQALENCEPPNATPEVPDGAIAEEAAMAEAGTEVRNFVEQTQQYLACLEARETELGDDITEEQRADIITIYNNAVETMQAVADDFNEQVARYREQIED